MKILAMIAILLLSLVGYSAGVALRCGKSGIRKPVFIDILIIGLMWAGVIYSRGNAVFGKWLLLLAWIAIGIFLGFFLTVLMGFSKTERGVVHKMKSAVKDASKKNKFQTWKDFSYRIGTFQSQVFLGLLYLILFAPVGIAVRFLSDPLNIKRGGEGSHWVPKKEVAPDLELFKRQF